jgi:hypothetical protein
MLEARAETLRFSAISRRQVGSMPCSISGVGVRGSSPRVGFFGCESRAKPHIRIAPIEAKAHHCE